MALDFAALIPCYDNGDVTRAISTDGSTTIINRNIKKEIRELMKQNNLDIKALRKNYGKFAGRKIIMPIPLNASTILIPVKVRKAVTANDGSFGYISMMSISEVSGNKALIKLRCGIDIESLEAKKTVLKRIEIGYMIKDKFFSAILGDEKFREDMAYIKNEYDRPATKADIAIITRELMLIRDKLGMR